LADADVGNRVMASGKAEGRGASSEGVELCVDVLAGGVSTDEERKSFATGWA